MFTIIILAVYLKALGLALNFVGSIILIAGTMKSQKEINTETKPGIPIVKSATIRKFLLKARSISMIGLIIITAGFLVQLIAILFDLYI
ncbi:MAG: hypothetical protein JW816_01575 [Candidatus Buchananbacteria bacterium]|nr:hypothetical protein [Candidatus Buchananbacteria bacterium]